MNKKELIAQIAEKAGIAKKDAEKALNAFVETVSGALKEGKKIQLVGLGTFAARERAARQAKNPRTGEAVSIPATVIPGFKAGKALKDIIGK